MPKTLKITAALLAKIGSCWPDLRLFKRTFPKGATITVASVRKAINAGLQIDWIAGHSTGSAKTCPACKVSVLSSEMRPDYDKITAILKKHAPRTIHRKLQAASP